GPAHPRAPTPRSRALAADHPAAVLAHGNHTGARQGRAAGRPMAERCFQGTALAGMLDAQEQCLVIRRELAAADLRTHRGTHELLQPAAQLARGRADPAAIVAAGGLAAV